MPVAYIDIQTGVDNNAKTKMFKELYKAIHDAWPIPDTRVLIREWPNEAVSQDGRIENVPMRPICTLAVPPDLDLDAKHRLIRQISNTVGEACGRETSRYVCQAERRFTTIGSSPSSGSFRLTTWPSATSWRPRIHWCSRTCLCSNGL
jgi:hypothetical protein